MTQLTTHAIDPGDFLRQELGLPVVAVAKVFGCFDLQLDDGREVHLGGVASLLRPEEARVAIARDVGVVIRRYSADAWTPVAQAVLDVAVDRTTPLLDALDAAQRSPRA